MQSERLRKQAGWSLALLLPVPTLGVVAGMVVFPDIALGKALFFLAKVWVFALPLLWTRLVDRAPFSASPMRHGGIGAGLATGLVIAVVIVTAYRLLGASLIEPGALVSKMSEIGLDSRGMYLGGAVYWIAVNSVLEEYVWRWFVVQQAERLLGTRAAVAVSAVGFTVHHVVALSLFLPPVSVAAAGAGILAGASIWSWLYARYRSIWPGYASHALADLAIFGVGYHLLF